MKYIAKEVNHVERWKPKIGEEYWQVTVSERGVKAEMEYWAGDWIDGGYYKSNNCHRTHKQAAAVAARFRKVLREGI